MKRYILLWILTTLLNFYLAGQEVYFQQLGSKQGLSQSSAISIWQDEIGRMWFANNVLNCYDGEAVRVFRVSEHTEGVEDSYIHALCGNNSMLFFLAENQLIGLDLNTEAFTVTGIRTNTICYSNDQVYYESGGELAVYDWQTQTNRTVASLPQKDTEITFILEMEKEIFWLGTTSGIYVIDAAQKQLKEHILPDEHILYLYKDSWHCIWIASQSRQIHLYTPNQQIIPLKIENRTNDSLFNNNNIYCIQEDIKGVIWIGTLTGVYQLSRSDIKDRFILRNHILEQIVVSALFSDRQGTIWVGPYYGDVLYHNPLVDNYTYYTTDDSHPEWLHGVIITQITEDKDGNLYVASGGSGINTLKPGSNSFEHITTANGLPQNRVRDIWYDKEHNRLFISAFMEGVFYLDLYTKKIHPVQSPLISSVHQRIIEKIIPYKNDLLLHTQNGIFKLNRETLQISWFLEDDALRELCSGIIRAIHIDERDILWVSSYDRGLFSIDLKNNKALHRYGDGLTDKSVIPSAIINICGNMRQGLYFITQKSGLLKYNAAENTFHLFNEEKDQLLSNICYNMVFSPNGNLVLTTNKGVSLINIAADNSMQVVYNIRINPSSPLTGLTGDCGMYISPKDHRIFVGGFFGLLCFSEKDIPIGQDLYSMYFSSLQINNKLIKPGSSLLDKNFYQVDKLTLPHNQNTINITFASSSYLSSRATQYAYKLEGLDDFWTETNHKTIIYNSLRPGKYKLIVRETENTDKKAELAITINPPVWATLPAILIYLSVFLLSVWQIIRFNRSKSLLRASLEIEQRENLRIEESNRNKMDFFINISNEFRTPLTLILSRLDHLSDDLPAVSKNKIEKIKRQASRLQDLITEMLDFRKMEQNKLTLKMGNHNIIQFLQGICATFDDYAEEKQLSFRFNHTNEPLQIWFDQKQMQKVFYHLLMFIFRTASAKDSITVSIHRAAGYVKIHITHKEITINENEANQLLEALNNNLVFQHITSFSDGAMGIAFSKGVLQLHKGELSAIHENNKTTVIISLLSGSSHIDMKDIEEPVEEAMTLLPPVINTGYLARDAFASEEEEEEEESNREKRPRMLLIEEELEMCDLFKESFSLTYEVIGIQDAKAAYDFAIREIPDIILCETHLPETSGIELCSMLKSNLKTDHIPVILLSSQPSEEQTMESIRCEADYYFVKPFNMKVLFLRCNYLVRSRRKILQHVPTESYQKIIEMATNEREQEFLAAANQVVEKNWENPDFDTQLWSRELNMSRTRFFNQIKKITGTTPNDYLLSLKMNKARALLQHEKNFTISEIAYQLGFTNPAYFTKCFKKQFGITPQEYRKK
ncbi:MAG: helix-turn-helix domain-containing protein [Tannerellaceae bacterium]|jgi:ligand-binding sensor domain-containing protein/AraC-like DNA-binding protein/signal transduction histidine kinase|nr:helix-turn-helix domain-containing protein [Tannerellaceae bacterium]